MAWQLIYTSAPRLLEAGRSGFGTVARHREIPALLVAAIERISQFSRQPGLDPARVIYAHRIISGGGQRYHVLSCIRDAGADYTGRTNHLAHHLVAEPSEVAGLDVSSADVLVQMPWLSAWSEPPRWLEPHENIPLTSFSRTAATGSPAWRAVTGDPRHAQVLVASEAVHGCYLLTPSHIDLRSLLAESLALAPERAWQTPYTTSLQPSDEPTDFRWIGLEATSPLRSAAEGGGRVMLDVENLRFAAGAMEIQPELRYPATSAGTEVTDDVHEVRASPVRSHSADSTPGVNVWREDKILLDHKRRRGALWISIVIGSLLLAAAVGGTLFYRNSTLRGERNKLVAQLPQFARAERLGETALQGISFSSLPKAKELGDAAWKLQLQMKLGEIELSTYPKLVEATNAAEREKLDVAAYRELYKEANLVLERRDNLLAHTFSPTASDPDKVLLGVVSTTLRDPAFEPSVKSLERLWVERKAKALRDALTSNQARGLTPRQFRTSLEELQKIKTSSTVSAVAELHVLLTEWEDLIAGKPIPQRDSWPSWMREITRTIASDRKVPSTSKPNQHEEKQSQGPTHYLALGFSNLKAISIPALVQGAKVFCGDDLQPLFHNNNALKKGPFTPILFLVDPTKQTLAAEDGARALKLPLVLRIEHEGRRARIEIIDATSDKPYLTGKAVRIERKVDSLKVDLSRAPQMAGVKWFVGLPGSNPDQFLPVEDGVASLKEPLRCNEQELAAWEARLALRETASNQIADPATIISKLRDQCTALQAAFPSSAASTPPVNTPSGELSGVLFQLGDLLQRLSHSLDKQANGSQKDSLYANGVALKNVESSPLKPAEAVEKAISVLKGLYSFSNEAQRQLWADKLKQAQAACETAREVLNFNAEAAKRQKEELANEIEVIKGEISKLKSNPLRSGGLPAGDYHCVAQADAQRVLIAISRLP